MIDTDRYEGHTEGPWEWPEEDSILLKGNGRNTYIITERHLSGDSIDKEADAALIADAPLLLEAYKRLRLVADELYLHIVGEPHMTLDELVAEMPWRNEE